MLFQLSYRKETPVIKNRNMARAVVGNREPLPLPVPPQIIYPELEILQVYH